MCLTDRIYHCCIHCGYLKMIESEPTLCPARKSHLDAGFIIELDIEPTGLRCTREVVESTKFDVPRSDCKRCVRRAERRRLKEEQNRQAEEELATLEWQREEMLARLEGEEEREGGDGSDGDGDADDEASKSKSV